MSHSLATAVRLVSSFALGISSSMIPFSYENGRPYVIGRIENTSFVSNNSVRLYLDFDSSTRAVLDRNSSFGVGAGSAVSLFSTGSVYLPTDEDEIMIHAYTDERIYVLNYSPGRVFNRGHIGMGASGQFLNESGGSLSFIPFSYPETGLLLVGFSEQNYTNFCKPNTLISAPFATPQLDIPDAGQARKLQGRFHLLDASPGARIEFPEPNQITNIGLFAKGLVIPTLFYLHIHRIIAEFEYDNIFENCDYVRSMLPIISMDLLKNETDVAGTVLFYPDDYTTKQNEESDVCTLNVESSWIRGEVGFDPLMLRQTNIRITQTNMMFCDDMLAS